MTPTRTTYTSGRKYVWPEKKPHELVVPSVTTIIGGGIPKPALAPWNAKMVATYAVEHREAWQDLEPADAIDLLKRSPFRHTKNRADEGTIVHTALDAYAAGLPDDQIPIPKNKSLVKQIEGALQFLRDFKVTPHHSEVTIFSREHEYAGTTDLLGDVTFPDEMFIVPQEARCIIDYKTGKAIYDDYAVQLIAYAFGDFIAAKVNGEPTELPVPMVDYVIVVRPKRRGGYEAKVFKPTEDVFELFLAAKVIHGRDDTLADASMGNMLTGPDEGEA